MAGTRARAIRANLVTALTGATLDDRAGAYDSLRHLDVTRRPASASERSFRVITATQAMRDDYNTCDAWKVEHTIEIYYALGPGVEDRISDDAERYWRRLETLTVLNTGIHSSDPAPLGNEETDQNMIARISVITRYRLDSAVIA